VIPKITSWKSRGGARAPVPHSWRRQCLNARFVCRSSCETADNVRMSLSNADWNSSMTSATASEDDCWTTIRCQLETTRFIVQKILVPLVVTFGVLGNAVTVAVLTRPWMRSSTNSYLTALAIYDLLYLAPDSAVSLTLAVTSVLFFTGFIVVLRLTFSVCLSLTDCDIVLAMFLS